MVYRGMSKKKSRHKKFRGRTYLEDLVTYLSAEDWDLVEGVVYRNATDSHTYTHCMFKLGTTEVQRIDVDSNSAGHASYRWNRIDLHTHLFTKGVPEGELRDTLFHEVAHLIAMWACGERGHGRKWRQVFADLGYPDGLVTHDMPRLRGTTGKPRTRTVYEYKCMGCGSIWTRHQKVYAPDCWHHKDCHGTEKGYRLFRTYKEVL